MPPYILRSAFRWLNLLLVLAIVSQPLLPVASLAAPTSAAAVRLFSEDIPEDTTLPIENEPPFVSIPEPESPYNPNQPPQAIPLTGLFDESNASLAESGQEPTLLPPAEISSSEPGLDVPIGFELQQDRYVMTAGERTTLSLQLFPHFQQDAVDVDAILSVPSPLVTVNSVDGMA
jgi:hypothetical protein